MASDEMVDWAKLRQQVETDGRLALFVTVSGAHLYGFNSPDSDVDLRGCHLAPLAKAVGLDLPDETIDLTFEHEGMEVDLVSHEARKYFGMLVKNNGYVLEQIFSPLVVTGQEFLDRLRPIAARCITRHHYYHYRGFFQTQLRLLEKQPVKTAKALLYAYRVLMTGIHLQRSGEVLANIVQLNQTFQLPFIEELISQKVKEKSNLPDLDWNFHLEQLTKLEAELDQAYADSSLPETRDREAVNNFLVDYRLGIA